MTRPRPRHLRRLQPQSVWGHPETTASLLASLGFIVLALLLSAGAWEVWTWL